MLRFYKVIALTLLIIGCSSEKKGNLTVSGNVKGLKKGILYIQKSVDTALVNLDSLIIDGQADFEFNIQVDQPEIHYLYLHKKDHKEFNDRLRFFAEPGTIIINTLVDDFEKSAKIAGGPNQTKFNEYQKNNTIFFNRNLKLMKEDYEARKQHDEEKLRSNDKKYDILLKQKYLYSINFAINNRKLEIAPYIALTEVPDANLYFLDSIANSLPQKVKKSYYGKQFLTHLEKRRTNEKSPTE